MAKYFDPRIEGDRAILYICKEVWGRETWTNNGGQEVVWTFKALSVSRLLKFDT